MVSVVIAEKGEPSVGLSVRMHSRIDEHRTCPLFSFTMTGFDPSDLYKGYRILVLRRNTTSHFVPRRPDNIVFRPKYRIAVDYIASRVFRITRIYRIFIHMTYRSDDAEV